MAEPIAGHVTQFIKHVGNYFSYYNAVLINCDILALQNKQRINNPQTAERIADCDHKHHVERAKSLELGRALAVELEGADFNTTDLLQFLHRLDGGGGAERAAPLWAGLKASLQRFAFRSAIGEDKRDGATPPVEAATHGPDFRSVHWYGTDYSFTKMQAPIVKTLWEAQENGTPDVGTETLLEAVDSKLSRLADMFRNNPAWGTLIVKGETKGSKRLAYPPTP